MLARNLAMTGRLSQDLLHLFCSSPLGLQVSHTLTECLLHIKCTIDNLFLGACNLRGRNAATVKSLYFCSLLSEQLPLTRSLEFSRI